MHELMVFKDKVLCWGKGDRDDDDDADEIVGSGLEGTI